MLYFLSISRDPKLRSVLIEKFFKTCKLKILGYKPRPCAENSILKQNQMNAKVLKQKSVSIQYCHKQLCKPILIINVNKDMIINVNKEKSIPVRKQAFPQLSMNKAAHSLSSCLKFVNHHVYSTCIILL